MILVAGEDSKFGKQITTALKTSGQATANVNDISGLDEAIEKHSPEVIVIDPSIMSDIAIAKAEGLSISNPEIAIIMAVDALDPGVLRAAMQAGIKDIIERESSDEQIIASISRAADISKRFKESFGLKADEQDEQLSEEGKVITFFSTKGGVGKSVLSANSAVALAQLTEKRVAILDLDLQFGDIAIMFQLTPDHTIYDVIQVIGQLDEDMLQGFLTVHSSGVKALLAPVRPQESDSITSNHVKQILGLLRKSFDYIIIDTPPLFNDITLTALDESDLIYLIATMDMPSIKNIKLAIQTLKQLGYPSEIVKFVLNRADSKVWLEIDEVEKTLDVKAVARIPSDRVIPRSVNKGVPVVIEQPKSAVAKSIVGLAEKTKDVKKRDDIHTEATDPIVRKIIRRLS
ncbi:MAG: AAA family ATPase [Candidatus Aquicultor sp.]